MLIIGMWEGCLFLDNFIPCYFVNAITRLKSFLVESLESLIYKNLSPASRDNLASSSLYFFHFSLITLAKTSDTIKGKNGQSEYLCLIPDFCRKVSIWWTQIKKTEVPTLSLAA